MKARLTTRDGATRELEVENEYIRYHRELVLPLVPKDFSFLTAVTDSTVIVDENGRINEPYFAHRRYRFVRIELIAIYEEIS